MLQSVRNKMVGVIIADILLFVLVVVGALYNETVEKVLPAVIIIMSMVVVLPTMIADKDSINRLWDEIYTHSLVLDLPWWRQYDLLTDIAFVIVLVLAGWWISSLAYAVCMVVKNSQYVEAERRAEKS